MSHNVLRDNSGAYLIKSTRNEIISTHLQLHQGPISLRNVECIALENEIPNVLLSRPILQNLVCNLDGHLESRLIP